MLFPQSIFVSFDLVDAAGILFFSHVFTLAHNIFETSVISKLEISWSEWFNNEQWIAPIRQCEATYKRPLLGGQTYDVDATILQIGQTSFSIEYHFCQKEIEYCSIKIVHVFCEKNSGKKIPIPSTIRQKLESL